MGGVLAFIEQALTLAPLIIQAGQDIKPFALDVYNAVTKSDGPTDADWAALMAKEAELRAVLQAPLDPPA